MEVRKKISSSLLLFLVFSAVYVSASRRVTLAANRTADDLNEINISRADSNNSQESPDTNGFDSSPSEHLTLAFDPVLTARTGAENIIGVHAGLTRAEDRFIGTRWFSEEGVLGKTGGIVCRSAKYVLIDLPVDIFSVVFAHEYFGHGARFREQDWGKVEYSFDAPPPYGEGGGFAAGTDTRGWHSYHELLALYSGGFEAQSEINRRLTLRWMSKREIRYREAALYFWSFQFMFGYIWETNEDLDANERGYDPAEYLRLINHHAGYYDVDDWLMDVRDLKSRAALNLANPFLLYVLFAQLKTYLWDGNNSSGFPVFHVKGTDYLPCLRMGLTPFGPEYHLENFLRAGDKVLLVDLRIGDQTFYESWGGIGLYVQNICGNRRLSVDLDLDVWNQPEIEVGGDSITSKGGGLGAAFSVRSHYGIIGAQSPISAVVELGYKSAGYLEGRVSDSGPIIMFGIAFRD